MSTLSARPVGTGVGLHKMDALNLPVALRQDGCIVKPGTPLLLKKQLPRSFSGKFCDVSR
jgi:hypothetical protein